MDSYEALAASYDELTEDVEYEKRADFVEKLFLRAKRPVKSLLDLACGTGTMTVLFARRGYTVTGVDYSPEMLAQAQQKLAAINSPPLLLCQSMPQLKLLEKVDAAICCLDSINYLTRPRDVQRTFNRLHDTIAPGGSLVFDIHAVSKMEKLDGEVLLDEREDVFCLWRTRYRKNVKMLDYEVDLFRLQPDGAWERDFEEHHQRAYTVEELTAWLDSRPSARMASSSCAARTSATAAFTSVVSESEEPYMEAQKDCLVRAISKDGFVNAVAVYTRGLTERARQIHHTSPVATAALGRALAACSMMGNALKDNGASVTMQIKGDGPLGTILTVSDSEGNVRGYVQNPAVDLALREDGKLDVGTAVGHSGTLTVIKDLNMREPYVGTVDLLGGEIAEDVAAYYVESEQVPSACGLGVLIDRDRSVLTAGGYLIQLLPGAGEDVITKVEGGIYAAPSVTNLLKENSDPAVLLKTVLSDFDMEILSVDPIEYRCYCSRERTERALLSLGSKELEKIVDEQGSAELTCQFCDRVQNFTKEDLTAMIADLKKQGK